jgi:hypothetical protein
LIVRATLGPSENGGVDLLALQIALVLKTLRSGSSVGSTNDAPSGRGARTSSPNRSVKMLLRHDAVRQRKRLAMREMRTDRPANGKSARRLW